MKVLVISHLYPSPGVERHLFVHEQLLALQELGVEAHVISPTPWAPRVLWRNERQRRRGEKPKQAVRDGITAEYPRVLQPPKRLLFDRLGDLAYRNVRSLPSVTAGSGTSSTLTRRCPTARSRSVWPPTCARPGSSPCTAPTSTSTSAWGAPWSAGPRRCSAPPTP